MSISLLKAILEKQDISNNLHVNFGIEFNKKLLHLSFITKLIEQNRATVLNFDISLYKYLLNKNIDKKHIHHLYNTKQNKQTYSKIFETKHSITITVGLDLLPEKDIHEFFKLNRSNLSNSHYNFFISALDNSYINLDDNTERKKSIIRREVGIYISEKANKVANQKLLVYSEFVNIMKLSKDIGIMEYTIDNSIPTFEKVNIYMKEYKDLFEVQETAEPEQPSSTFKLSLNENELNAKNEVILPYLNKDKPIIEIDQDDLNELYEEDPDGDLDI